MEESLVAKEVLLRRRREVHDRVVAEEDAEQAACGVQPVLDALLLERLAGKRADGFGRAVDDAVDVVGAVPKLRETRSNGDRVSAERPGLVDGAGWGE